MPRKKVNPEEVKEPTKSKPVKNEKKPEIKPEIKEEPKQQEEPKPKKAVPHW